MYGYIGSFPPPFGGVTVKNNIWFDELKDKVNITKIEFSKNPIFLIGFLFKLIWCEGFVVGIGSSKRSIIFMKLIANFFPNKVKKSIVVIMGGKFGNLVLENDEIVKYYIKYKGIFVEFESMQKQLYIAGLKNVYYMPNARKRPSKNYGVRDSNGKLKCVIFSAIYPEKGIDIALEAASRLPDINFSFWGEIKKEYKMTFLEQIEQYENCTYCGICKNKNGKVYEILNQYDVLLFPTRWRSEGMPGTIVESKIAGLPAVVSRWAYNTELVTQMYDGIIMKTNDVEGLFNAIKLLDENRDLLMQMKRNAKRDSEKYFIDNYINDVIDIFQSNRVNDTNFEGS